MEKTKKILILGLLTATLLFFGFLKIKVKHDKNNFAKYTGQKAKEPNIIFVLVDDMGWGDLGVFYQDRRKNKHVPFEVTPNIDKMAREGVQLRDHYDAAPVCAPSRASILLGLSQGHANVRDNQFDHGIEDNHTIASTMRKLGYSTVAVGKYGEQGSDAWDPGRKPFYANPLKRGFEDFFGYMRHIDGHEHYPKEGIYSGDSKQVWENHTDITPELDKCYTGDLWTAYAKKWIVDHEKGKNAHKPFFMYLAYDTPHAVLELPTQAYPKGKGLHGGLQWIGKPGHMINTASGRVDSWVNPEYANALYDNDNNPATPEVPWPDVYKRYATSVSRIDRGVGDIIQLLKDLHIAGNTLVVFSSDNGPSEESYLNSRTRKNYIKEKFKPNKPTFFRSFGPFDGIKRDCWEGGVRVPTVAYWPGHIPEGRVVTNPSISYDWMATFTEAAGVPAPEVSDGVSLLPDLTGKGKQIKPLIYIEYYHRGRTPGYSDFAPQHRDRRRGQMQMIRIGDYVGVRYNIKSQNDNFEIYNIVKDPEELHNLAETLKYPETADFIKSLQEEMKNKVLEVRRPSAIAPRPYDSVPVPAVKNITTRPGVEWKIYKGNYPWVPQVTGLHADKTGVSNKPGLDMVDNKENEVVCYTGYLNVPADGNYTFFLRTDTGAELRIHDATVIDEDYKYWGGIWQKSSILLKAGLHPFKLYYRRQPKLVSPSLDLKWITPDMKQISEHSTNTGQSIPAEIFRYKG